MRRLESAWFRQKAGVKEMEWLIGERGSSWTHSLFICSFKTWAHGAASIGGTIIIHKFFIRFNIMPDLRLI